MIVALDWIRKAPRYVVILVAVTDLTAAFGQLEYYVAGCNADSNCGTCMTASLTSVDYCNGQTSCWNYQGTAGQEEFTACVMNVPGTFYCNKGSDIIFTCSGGVAFYYGCVADSGYGPLCNSTSNPDCACSGTGSPAGNISVKSPCTDF